MNRPCSLGRRRRGYQFGIYLTKELILQGWIICLLQITIASDSHMRVISGCYGKSIALSCVGKNEVIVVESLKVGSKPLQGGVNCSVESAPKSCCKMDKNRDCTFNYQSKVSSDKHEIRVCQGKLRECPMKVIWAQNDGKCPSSKYPSTTEYMVANYKCANQNNVMEMCGPSGYSKIISNSTVHLRNYLYPNLSQNNRNCLCNISTMDGKKKHTLRVKAIDVLFNCSHSLAFSDRLNNLTNVPCEKALYGLSNVYSSRGRKPKINLRYQTINETNIYLWVEVSVDNPETNAIEVVCQNMSEEYRMVSELAVTKTPDTTTSKGTTGTIYTTTRQVSASPASSHLEEEEGDYDSKLIGGVTAGLFLVALLMIILFFIWKRKRSKDGGAQGLRYSSDSNPYDNFNDNPGYQEEIYDTIPDSQDSSAKPASSGTSQPESVPNHTYESLKNNGYAQFPDKKGGPINSSVSGSDTSLPKELAPLPPTPDHFRRLPSVPKEVTPAEAYDVIEKTQTVPEDIFLQSARSSTQTMLETLTGSDPDLSSRESITDCYSLEKSGPTGEHTGTSINIQGTSPSESGKSSQIDAEVKIASSSGSGKKKIIPPPAIYHDNE